MQRAFSIALSLAAVALSIVLAFRGAPSLGATSTGAPLAADGGSVPDAGASIDAAPAPVAPLAPSADLPNGAPHAPDGTQVAELGRGAPKVVRFGVILVAYEGAEGAPDKGARRKSDALSLATKLADQARQSSGDFKSAVQRGDTGSSDDVGEVTRGVLEPDAEAVLFALPVGGVSGVIDTPRGFWIVKRLE